MSKKVLLFIPGYYGSKLKEEKTGILRWAKASNFLFSQEGVSLEIPQTEIGSKKKLIVDGLLTNVKVFHKIWNIDAYGVTTSHLKAFAQAESMSLEVATFDWREDFIDCIKTIDQKIKNLDLKEEDELHVVAHSMGALLFSYYIRYGTQDVDGDVIENWAGMKLVTKVALVAPPLHGLMILFRDLDQGTRLGVNRRLLSARDYSTFKSSYFFLPPKGEDIGRNEKGEKFSLGIHDVDKWEKYKWGPFKFSRENETPVVRDFVSKYMKRSERFHDLLRAQVLNSPVKNLPVLHMSGFGQKTLELATVVNRKSLTHYVFDRRGAVDGDGTVTVKSGAALPFFRVLGFKGVELKMGHLDILAKSESQKIIQDFFKE